MHALHSNSGFDYESLPADIASEARIAADRIHDLRQKASTAIIAIGRELIQIKGKLDHGQFGNWLAAEFKMTDRTARNYMQVAKTFGDEIGNAVSDLPVSALYLLAAPSTPEKVRQQAVERAARGNRVTAAGLRREISRVVSLPVRPANSKRHAGPNPQTLGARISAADTAFHLCAKAGIEDHQPIVSAAVDAVADDEDAGTAAAAAIRANVAGVLVINAASSAETAAGDIVAQLGFNKARELARAILAMRAAKAA